MKTFKELINESLSLDAVNKNIQDKEVTVFMGRFQPPTLAHIDIIEDAYKKLKLPVVVAIVKSGNDQSPFPVKLIQKIIKSSTSAKFQILELKSGFIGDFISPLRDKGFEPVNILAGSDRVKSYKGQIKRYKELFNLNLEVKEILRSDLDISASKVRQSIADDDIEVFKSMTAKGTWQFYSKLKKYIG